MWCVRFIAVTLLFLLPIGSAGAAASPAASDGASLGLAALSADGGSADALTLVADGVAFAAVVIADDADEQTRQAALKLARYVKAATGATLPVLRESELATNRADAGAQVFVHVGHTQGLRPEALQALEDLDEDGFVIHAADGRIDIVGPSPWGTEFGVDEFLERYVGVRWLFPGPLGEDVPSVPHLAVPQELVRDEPAFISRVFSGLRGSVQAEWARNNRMRGRIQFHHNLHRLFPPAQYGQTHPEFYPLRHGRRVIPTGETGWQPCFTAPGIVEEAVKNIVAYFDANPQATSYSLGVNDSGGHCEAEPDHPDYPGALNSIGRVNMSEIYYAWVNQVVEGVLEKHPDKYFGLLAYSHVYDPPTGVKLHPRVIPYITDDRMTWADPVLGERGRELTRKWSEAAPGGLGWYEYLYGSPYMVPRFHVHQMAENYRFARANGAVAMYAELYPNWGEGPKPWISAKLQWNPDQDVDALLEEWYVRAVGGEAAPYLAAYYAHWEDFWTRRVFASDWYTSWRDGSSRSNYLPFHRPEYLQLVTAEEMAESRRLLEAVVEKARTQAQKARAELLLQAFEYYESSVLSYLGDDVTFPASEEEALRLLDRFVASLRAADERLRLADEFERHPVLVHPLSPRRYPSLMWSGLNGPAFVALQKWATENPAAGALRRRIEQIAAEDASATVRRCMEALLAFIEGRPPLNANPSFEDGQGTGAAPWWYWNSGTAGSFQRTGDAARTGSYSVVATGVARGGPVQEIPIQAGSYLATVSFYAPPESKTTGTVQIVANLRSATGQVLQVQRSEARPAASPAGRWSGIALVLDVPEQIDGTPVHHVQLVLVVNGFTGDEVVYLDDAYVYPLASSGRQ